jgi:hypothetical protein
MIKTSKSVVAAAAIVVAVAGLVTIGQVLAQSVVTTPSKKTLEEASKDDCANVSSVVQRCESTSPDQAPAKKSDDGLTKSREATKAAFDRRDQRARDEALKGQPAAANTPVGDAQELGAVTVTAKAVDDKPSVEEILQKALSPPPAMSNGNGTTSRYAPNGSRFDCIEKCVGPACCVEVRALPNPARDSNSIGH